MLLPTVDPIIKKRKKKKRIDHDFNSFASVDAYADLPNQYGMKTINNNQVIYNEFEESIRHEMTQMYFKYVCKQKSHTLIMGKCF